MLYHRLSDLHGRRNGFESGTAEGVEHEPPKVANRDAEGVEGVEFEEGVSPSPTRGSGGNTPGIFF